MLVVYSATTEMRRDTPLAEETDLDKLGGERIDVAVERLTVQLPASG